MRRAILMVGVVCAAVAASAVIWTQHAELHKLRQQSDILGELCKRERAHAETLVAFTTERSSKLSFPLDAFGSRSSLKACLPGVTFDFREAEGCWIKTGQPLCARPVLEQIATEYKRRW